MTKHERWNMVWRESNTKPKLEDLQIAKRAVIKKDKSTRLEEEYINVVMM